ncbi:MAG: radical SAM protein [Phycisphaerales bacterium]|nr:radical SAM protein [Phycisphaerales bacterium]
MKVQDIDMQAVVAGKHRLTPVEALTLYQQASTHDLGQWAFAVAQRKLAEAYPQHQGKVRTYVIDRNINYTNVCSANCTFCAFKRDLGEQGSYTLTTGQLHEKVRQLTAIGGTQILLQGGMHPELPIEFYEDMLRGLKAEFPQVHIHGFSPPEVVEFIAIFKLEGFPVTAPGHSHEMPWEVWIAKGEAILRRLRQAGLDSIPGGGGEIFAPAVRRRIGLGKATAAQWLEVMSMAHRLGMSTSATMMFGHIEGLADRIDHLERVRQAQDQAILKGWPGRYVSFIAWPFQRENTPLGRVKEWDRDEAAVTGEKFPGDALAEMIMEGKVDGESKADCDAAMPDAGKRLRSAGAVDYLRTQALARLYLDNVLSIGASWVTMGPKIGQMGLYYGASDMGSVMMEENVVSAAGTTYCLDEPVLCHLIRSAGFMPAQRDNRYQLLKVHDTDAAPDLQVKDWSAHRAKRLHHESHEATTDDQQTAIAAASKTMPQTDHQGMVTLTISENTP